MSRIKSLLDSMKQPKYKDKGSFGIKAGPQYKDLTKIRLALNVKNSQNVLQQSLANYTQSKTQTQNFETQKTNISSDRLSSNDRLNYIGRIESGGKYSAVNAGSGAMGKYQFMPKTLKGYGVDTKLFMASPTLQEAIANKHLKYVEAGLKRNGIPINNRNVYGAWQQGVTGFSNIYKGNDSSVSLRNIKSNGATTVQGWRNKWLLKK